MLPIFLIVLGILIAKQWLRDLQNAVDDAQRIEDEKKGAIEAGDNSDDGK